MKKGDFITINYTGKLSDGTVFDTTREDVAKETGIDTKTTFAPVTICVGERMILPGLDEALIGKKTKSFSVTLSSERAFGKKDPGLLQMIPTEQLRKRGIRPEPGMQLTIDGQYGVVKRTGGGRTVVDFNHPLASQDVTYDVEVLGKEEDPAAQVRCLLSPLGLGDVSVAGKKAVVTVPKKLPEQLQDMIAERITSRTSVTDVSFEEKK